MPSDGRDQPRVSRISRDIIAGLFLVLLAAAAYFGIRDLPLGDPSGIGPGLVPKLVAGLIALLGLFIVALGLPSTSARLERFSLRGPLFVLGAVVLFGSLVRPLGIAVAGPVAVIFAGAADRTTRPVELIVFALVLSALSIGLFKYALRLPIPLAPFLLGY
jgi:putative tricarboxylic transport membrane protein